MAMQAIPLSLIEANAVVAAWHRHHQPVKIHRFSIGAVKDRRLVGVAIVSTPVNQFSGDAREVAEVRRVATDGTYNACSFLYGACARTAKAMGFHRIQSYILPEEGGASLRAANWQLEVADTGRSNFHSRPGRIASYPLGSKQRWGLILNAPVDLDLAVVPWATDDARPSTMALPLKEGTW